MLSLVDIGIILAFVAYSAASGLRSRKISSQNLEEYFLAGRTLPGWKAGISMAATQFAADTPLLVTGMIATAGVFSLWRLWIYTLAFLFLGFVLAGSWRRARVLTDAELAELRYGSKLATVLRGAKAIYFGTVFNCTVMAMVLLAATRIAEPFLLWHEWLPASMFERVVAFVEWAGVPLTTSTAGNWAELSANNLLSLLAILAVTTLYSTTGGLRAVVNTDLLQFIIAMLATLIYAVVVIRSVGGLGALPDRLVELYGAVQTRELLAFTPTRARDASWLVIGTIAIQWIAQMNADGTGYLAQRTMACRTERDSRRAAVVFVVAQILLRSLLWIPIGLGLLVLMPVEGATEAANVAAREVTFVDGIVRYLPSGARGLMVAGMLAALASTIDTHLNWGASYWTNDLYKRLICQAWRRREPSGRSLVIVARLSNLLILTLAIVILTQLGSIQSAWQTSLLLGAGMGTPLVLRWIWWRVTAAAELGAIITSTIAAPLLLITVDSEGGRMLVMASISTLVVVGITLFGRGEARESLAIFYGRVRPPGFWGPLAREFGEDEQEVRRRLWRGIMATGIGALTVFSALVAAGSWLYKSPPPTWLPSRTAWIALLLASAGVLAWLLTRLITDPTASIRRTQNPIEPGA